MVIFRYKHCTKMDEAHLHLSDNLIVWGGGGGG